MNINTNKNDVLIQNIKQIQMLDMSIGALGLILKCEKITIHYKDLFTSNIFSQLFESKNIKIFFRLVRVNIYYSFIEHLIFFFLN